MMAAISTTRMISAVTQKAAPSKKPPTSAIAMLPRTAIVVSVDQFIGAVYRELSGKAPGRNRVSQRVRHPMVRAGEADVVAAVDLRVTDAAVALRHVGWGTRTPVEARAAC